MHALNFAAMDNRINKIRDLGTGLRSDFLRMNDMEGFINSLDMPFHSIGFDGEIIWANAFELRVLGYESYEFIGTNLSYFLVDPSAIERARKLNGGPKAILVDVRCKNNTLRRMFLGSNLRLYDSVQDSHESILKTPIIYASIDDNA